MGKFRKKYTREDAEATIENTMQQLSVSVECIRYWKYGKRDKTDILIEALCGQSRSEMIENEIKKCDYLNSKLEYLYTFAPGYKPKLAF